MLFLWLWENTLHRGDERYLGLVLIVSPIYLKKKVSNLEGLRKAKD